MEDAPAIVVDGRARAWAALSHVPLTRPWRRYRAAVRWLDASLAHLEELVGDVPDWPRPLPRNPDVIDYAIGSMEAVLQGAAAVGRGVDAEDVRAIVREHRPDRPPVFVQ